MQTDVPLLNSLNLDLLPQSVVQFDGAEYGLASISGGIRLVCLAANDHPGLTSLSGEASASADSILVVGNLNPKNAAALRTQLPWLQPKLLGLHTSVGMGDRLGLATPGHIRAMRAAGSKIAPIFAQQSIREMNRTRRTPQQVMDNALWGIFQENWQAGFGADADHLKSYEDIDACLLAGFTFFTIDPGAFVDNRAEFADLSDLREMAGRLPYEVQVGSSDLLGNTIKIEGISISFDERTLLKARVKYGRAMHHVAKMFRYLEANIGNRPFELEVSVDETEQRTTHAEHAYIANELARLGVRWVSLAPRFIGRFEKGVDYIGDLDSFEADIAGHASISRHFGHYKLSLHSGSDKFSIYEIAMRQTKGLIHLKTAGTSYLEALRTIATVDPKFFLEIYAFARERYEQDRASYHVSAQLSHTAMPCDVKNPTELLDQFDAREILHVTFGSVLDEESKEGEKRFYGRFMEILKSNPEIYACNLEKHFARHLRPFSS